MPIVQVHIQEGRSPSEKDALLQFVHAALIEAFQTPEDDRTLILHEHPPAHFQIPPAKSATYTLIEITAFPGRSSDAKKRLYQGIVRKLSALEIAPSDILIVISEPPLENWGIRGGIPASESELGFRIDV